ncbi:MAG: site-2 protease family protein [Candidatus Gottesmanbacteria bacterium]|nr:site-2 protease family protein [Candidatus Gottesmanbacteria bacterium]
MLGELSTDPLGFLLGILALVIAITIHEFAHAWSADRLGDPTPRLMGRLTLNPLAHLDPIGTIMLLIVRFGWGKPVQFDPYNLRFPRRDSALISLAGPVSNLLLALVCSILLNVLMRFGVSTFNYSIIQLFIYFIISLLQPLIIYNVILAIFNLVPIHPLDGFKIVGGILPEEYAHQWAGLERYGMIFLIFLILPLGGGVSPIHQIISPIISFILGLLLPIARFI